jgi:hypothetical protein
MAPLDYDFHTVGVEKDPISGVLYACSGPQLMSVNESTGHVTTIGTGIHVDPTCSDLGATWLYVECLDLD